MPFVLPPFFAKKSRFVVVTHSPICDANLCSSSNRSTGALFDRPVKFRWMATNLCQNDISIYQKVNVTVSQHHLLLGALLCVLCWACNVLHKILYDIKPIQNISLNTSTP
ncbi:hypothetical protein ATANTOWER_007429 [Ataeniobius toweri]|uniref:Uncharacterized protein n=1 Tax=Ataeniobius toweri TaxID=208326 RepID=A0ABU7CBU6_9TELE|nr:hypothetical protein [Ataeniobius toweri]